MTTSLPVFVSRIDDALYKVAAQSGLEMLSEAGEEYLQSVLEPLYRNLIFGENNNIDLLSDEALYSALLGALSGGVMNAPANVANFAEAVNERTNQQKIEAAIADIMKNNPQSQQTTDPQVQMDKVMQDVMGKSKTARNFVRLVEKISSDLGVPIVFKSGQQIKADFIKRQTEVIANLESIANPTQEQMAELASLKDTLAKVQSGQIVVNGDITANGIVLNTDTDKPLNRVVGHEVTHKLSTAKHYAQLRDAVFAYARAKGVDIDSKLADRGKLYEGIADANPEAELVADLVGDYLFTDYEFVSNLSVEHQNVFQWLWNEIKYLCKIATAGSQEARDLARLEKVFADAYRAKKNTTTESGVKYHASYSKKNPKYLDPKTVTKQDVANAINSIAAGEYDGNSYVPIRISTPGIVQERLFTRDLPMAMPVHKVEQAMREDQGAVDGKNIRGHGFTTDDIISIIEKMDSPERLYIQPSNGRGVAVVSHEKNGGKTAVFVEFDCNINPAYLNGYEGGTYNLAISPFDVDGGMAGLFAYAQKNHWEEVFNKEKEGDPAKKFPATRPFAVEQDSLGEMLPSIEKEVKHQYSLSDSDGKQNSASQKAENDYWDALSRGDMVSAQKMVDEAAKAAGYTQKAYHGTGKDFTVFSKDKIGGRNVWGKGFYFGASKGIADDYASWRESKGGKYRIVSASLKMDNPFVPYKSPLGSAEEILDKWFPDMWKGSRELGIGYINGKLENSPLDLLQFIADHNKIEVRDVLSAYGYDSVKDGGELVVFSPEQIKSNEPVTFDDDGNPIPLSQRFNTEKDDIRYSMSQKGEQYTPIGDFDVFGKDIELSPIDAVMSDVMKQAQQQKAQTASQQEQVDAMMRDVMGAKAGFRAEDFSMPRFRVCG